MYQMDYGSNIILFVPAVLISIGLIMIFKKDWIWTYTEQMLQDVKPQCTPEWERRITINGVMVLLAGLFWLGLIVYILFT